MEEQHVGYGIACPQEPMPQDRWMAIMSAIFWDLNDACHIQKIVQGQPEQIDLQIHRSMDDATQQFIDQSLTKIASEFETPPRQYSRVLLALDRLGWKIFAICAHAEAFRLALDQEGDTTWSIILDTITSEQRCIEIFVRTRGLDWRGPLLPRAGDNWKGLNEALAPEINLATEHPHHVIQTLDGHLRRPVYEGHPQLSMKGSYYNPQSFPGGANTPNPLKREARHGVCQVCNSVDICKCEYMYPAGDLIELREYPVTGGGVRALSNFKREDVLGDFNGVLCPQSHVEPIYSMQGAMQYQDQNGKSRSEDKCMVDPSRFGSWTRFCSHHCEQCNACCYSFIEGDHATLGVYASKDIKIFNEISINYGPQYWNANRPCKCGDEECISHRGYEY